MQQSLKQLATALAERQPIVEDDGEGDRGIAAQLEQFDDAMPPKLQLIRTQVALALRLLPKLRRAADEAVQIFGGMGLMDELPLERMWRDTRVDRIWDGTSEIQRHIISRQLLRKYGG
mgnify:CR=1 FL=1